MRKIFLLLIIFSFSHCGFEPMYSSNKLNYKINIDKINGDKLINNKIVSEIKRNSGSNNEKVFNIDINTKYEKTIISKDSKGSVSDYQLTASTNFLISHNGTTETVLFVEKQNVKNNSNLFEQKNYETTIKNNFAISLVRKLNLKLLNK